MTEAGPTMVKIAQENGQWQAAIDRENPDIIPPDLEKALGISKGSFAACRELKDSKKSSAYIGSKAPSARKSDAGE